MLIRYLSTGVYWITFLYFINYTLDILIQIEKECRKKQMNNFMRMNCFLTNIKLLIGMLCCFISYYLAYYSPRFSKGSLLDKGITALENTLEDAAFKKKN